MTTLGVGSLPTEVGRVLGPPGVGNRELAPWDGEVLEWGFGSDGEQVSLYMLKICMSMIILTK